MAAEFGVDVVVVDVDVDGCCLAFGAEPYGPIVPLLRLFVPYRPSNFRTVATCTA